MTAVWSDLVEDARFAPSGHNAQPWRVRVRSEREADLEVPVSRLLPVEDPGGAFMTASIGVFLEALDVAAGARGLSLRYEPLHPDLGAAAVEPGRHGAVRRLRRAPGAHLRPVLLAAHRPPPFG